MELMPSIKVLGAIAIVAVGLLMVPQAAAKKSAQPKENYVTRKRFERLENAVESLAGIKSTVESLEESVKSLRSDFSSLSKKLRKVQAGQGQAERPEEKPLTVLAYTKKGLRPLNFGFFGGSMSPLAMMMFGKGKGTFSIPSIKPPTPVVFMGPDGPVRSVEIRAYATSENGFTPMNLPVTGGMTVIPPVSGFISGTATAPGYGETAFYAKTGKVKAGKAGGGKAGEIAIRTIPPVLKPGKSAVVRAVRNGKIAEGVKLSIYGKKYPNPAQITVPKGQPSLYVEVLKGGKTVKSETISISGGHAGGGGWSVPWWLWFVIGALVLGVLWRYRYKWLGIGSSRVT